MRKWLEIHWVHGEGWKGLSVEDGWVNLPHGPPIDTLRRLEG